MSTSELTAAEEALETAREARAEAEAKVQRLEELIAEHEAEAEKADGAIQAAYEEGTDPSDMADLRRRRGLARLEAEDLKEDRSRVHSLLAKREHEVAEAEIQVARIRWSLEREKGEKVGREVWKRLLEVQELVDELEALDASARRQRSIMDSRGYDGAWWPKPSEVAGFPRSKGWGNLFSELERQIRRHREAAPLPATGTG